MNGRKHLNLMGQQTRELRRVEVGHPAAEAAGGVGCAGADADVHGEVRKRRGGEGKSDFAELPPSELERLIRTLEEEMHEAAAELKFEYAARLRDEVNELRRELKEAG